MVEVAFPRAIAFWFYVLSFAAGVIFYVVWGIAYGSWDLFRPLPADDALAVERLRVERGSEHAHAGLLADRFPARLLPAPSHPVEAVARIREGRDRERVVLHQLVRAIPHRDLHQLQDGAESLRQALAGQFPLLPRVPPHG